MSIFLANPLNESELLQEKSILQNRYPFKALWVFGGVGTGKSFFINNILGLDIQKAGETGNGFNEINSDNLIEDVFPRFGVSLDFTSGEKEATDIQQKSRNYLQRVERNREQKMLNRAYPLLYNTNGPKASKEKSYIKSLIEIGYDVAVLVMYVPEQISIAANISRGLQGGRQVPHEVVSGIAKSYEISKEQYLEQEGYTVLGNDLFWNVFDFSTGDYRKEVKAIPGLVKELSDKGITFERVKKQVHKIKTDFDSWSRKLENPTGSAVLEALRTIRRQTASAANLGSPAERMKLGNRISDLYFVAACDTEKKQELGVPNVNVDKAVSLLPDGEKFLQAGRNRQTELNKTKLDNQTIRKLTSTLSESKEIVEPIVKSLLKERDIEIQ